MDTRGSGPISEETFYKRGGEEKENEKICFQTSRQRTIKQAVQTLRPPFSRWSRDRESSQANNQVKQLLGEEYKKLIQKMY